MYSASRSPSWATLSSPVSSIKDTIGKDGSRTNTETVAACSLPIAECQNRVKNKKTKEEVLNELEQFIPVNIVEAGPPLVVPGDHHTHGQTHALGLPKVFNR